MNKQSLLRFIAKSGSKVGFGAKRHFATFDIVDKSPTIFSVSVLLIGVLKVAYNEFPYQKETSILLILIGVIGIYLNQVRQNKDEYQQVGTKLTRQFYELEELYYKVKDSDKADLSLEIDQAKSIMEDFYNYSISNQILGADFYAYIKFFTEMQIEWIDDELHFQFFRDKIPNSIKFLSFIILLILIYFLVKWIYTILL